MIGTAIKINPLAEECWNTIHTGAYRTTAPVRGGRRNHMVYVYREKSARHIALDQQALAAFLKAQNFEEGFIKELAIFFLPGQSAEEDYLHDHSPRQNSVSVYFYGCPLDDLNRCLLEAIRLCALEEYNAPWDEPSFLGAQDVTDEDKDVAQFGLLADAHHFLTFSDVEQPEEEEDTIYTAAPPARKREREASHENRVLYRTIAVIAFSLFALRLLQQR